jgi:FtsZ-interacting cell division protein ZipA
VHIQGTRIGTPTLARTKLMPATKAKAKAKRPHSHNKSITEIYIPPHRPSSAPETGPLSQSLPWCHRQVPLASHIGYVAQQWHDGDDDAQVHVLHQKDAQQAFACSNNTQKPASQVRGSLQQTDFEQTVSRVIIMRIHVVDGQRCAG